MGEHRRLVILAAVLAAVGAAAVVVAAQLGRPEAADTAAPSPAATPTASPTDDPAPAPAASGTATGDPGGTPGALGEPWGSVTGLLQFRGNPSHTWYGRGPLPDSPEVAWRYPDRAMCFDEILGYEDVVTEEDPPPSPQPAPDGTASPAPQPAPRTSPSPVVKRWCGTGWTGQPVVWERPDGVTEVVVGTFDGAVHFVDLATGRPTRTPFRTGEMIKGTVTLDPDGLPLLYTGSRDNRFRVVAIDRDPPVELWSMGPHPQGVWNNDWDGNASVVDDVLYVGGEDSWFRAVRLNRGRDEDGRVTVAPEVLVEVPGFDEELFDRTGDANVSIEASPALDLDRGRVYVANSGGRVLGLDLAALRRGEARTVLDVWLGDDIDASPVVGPDGMVYVAAELERRTDRAVAVGQLVKLDPSRPADPIVWGVDVPARPPPGVAEDAGGIWATPALYGGHLYVTTHPGDLLVVDAATGEVVHREDIGYHEWSSPVVVEDPATGGAALAVGACEAGGVLGYDLTDPDDPRRLWEAEVPTGACVESTPAVWEGRMVVGARDGFLYGFAG